METLTLMRWVIGRYGRASQGKRTEKNFAELGNFWLTCVRPLSIMSIDKLYKGSAMRLTTKSEYSILALIYIARHCERGFVKIEDICSHYDISKKYLELLLSILKQNRYIKTKRGSSGGYTLAKPASRISLAEIIRVFDGALAPTESVSRYFFSHTPLEKEKKIMGVFKEIRDYVAARLEALRLSDLV